MAVSTRVVLAIGLVVTAVGMLDSSIGAEWDLFVVFLLSGLVYLSLWLKQRAGRVPLSLRPDLARWLERRSQTNGERIEDLLDRSVAWYQQGLYSQADIEK